jgi:hypothetical protein
VRTRIGSDAELSAERAESESESDTRPLHVSHSSSSIPPSAPPSPDPQCSKTTSTTPSSTARPPMSPSEFARRGTPSTDSIASSSSRQCVVPLVSIRPLHLYPSKEYFDSLFTGGFSESEGRDSSLRPRISSGPIDIELGDANITRAGT